MGPSVLMHAAVPFTVTDKRMTLNANVSLGPFSTAQQLSSALNRNELSAEELLMATVERIEAANPTVNAIVAMDVDAARKAARESDERRAANAVRGPLDGIPMTVKDSIAVEGFPATSGFPPLANFRPNSDAPSVSRLRRAGVTIVGKSNLSTMASDFQCDKSAFRYYAQPLEPGDDVRRLFGRRGSGLGCRHDTAGVR